MSGGNGNYQETVSKNPEQEVTIEGARMTLFEHLGELANRLKKCLYAFIVAFAMVSALPNPLHPLGGAHALFGYNFLVVSLLYNAQTAFLPKGVNTFVTGLMDPISIFINISLVLAVVIALPVIFHEIYGFVAPGLYTREKRAIRKYLVPFTILFVVGALFGLFVIFPLIMRILIDFMSALVGVQLVSLNDFVNLMLLIPVMTGLAFTFPVFIIPLVEFKILKASQLVSSRKWVYAVVCLSVSIANPDPTDLTSVPIVVPILILFEVTVLLAKRIEKNRAKRAAAIQAAAELPAQP